ncbi:mate-domain-containing protein [Zychaea mexicana]|uniref:mate-domain-containing protein n=1 Tax=Zychaea mexicana TaxID=64656 RepID=UPI0022FEFC39|nr:mate-domain-containing protein [Zychaea mexicana]KAI9498796.1 mate-domain-containing protein [Zychaea mexicana]
MAKVTERSPLLDQQATTGTRTVAVQLAPTWPEELNWLFYKSVPVTLYYILKVLINIASVLALGHLGSTELAASALATIFLSTTWFTVTYGASSALDTLCSQAWTGAQDRKLVGVHLQRALVILSIMHVPVALLWLNASRILLAIGQEPEVALYAGIYLRYYLIGAPAYAFSDVLRKYLQAIGIMSAATYVLMIVAPIHIVLTYILTFCEPFNLGFDGVPLAASLTSWIMFFLLATYTRFSPEYYEGWGGWTRACLSDWNTFFRFAVPGIVTSYVELGSSHLISFGASYLGTTELAAQSIIMNVHDICSVMGWGVSGAVATRVGNALGNGRPADAQQAVRCAYGLILGLGSLLSAALMVWSDSLGYLFTPDIDIVLAVATMIPLLAIAQVFLGLGNVATGVLRAAGRPEVTAWINTVMYYAIGIPTAYSLAFKADWQLAGLVTGLCLGIIFTTAGHLLYIHAIDWFMVVQRTQERIQSEESKISDEY